MKLYETFYFQDHYHQNWVAMKPTTETPETPIWATQKAVKTHSPPVPLAGEGPGGVAGNRGETPPNRRTGEGRGGEEGKSRGSADTLKKKNNNNI